MVIYADTSFLFSLYGNDVNSGRASAWARQSIHPIRVLDLTLFGLENALRFATARGFIPAAQCEESFQNLEHALAAQRLSTTVCNLANIVARARLLSANPTPTGAHRAFDILHVAAALEIGAECFLTFDANQQRLARLHALELPFCG